MNYIYIINRSTIILSLLLFVIFLIENFYNNLSQAGFFDAFPNLKLNSKKVNSLTVTKGKSPKDLNHEKHLAMLEFLSSEVGL